MSNDLPDGAGPRGTLPLGVGHYPSPAAPQPSCEARMTEPADSRRCGVWSAPTRTQIALAKARAGGWRLAVDVASLIFVLALLVRGCAQVTAPRVPAQAVPAVELHQERELRGSIAGPSCPSCAAGEPDLHQPAGLASSASALRASTEASAAPRPSKPPVPQAKRAQRKSDVVDPWERR
jgi:hypothetical protein